MTILILMLIMHIKVVNFQVNLLNNLHMARQQRQEKSKLMHQRTDLTTSNRSTIAPLIYRASMMTQVGYLNIYIHPHIPLHTHIPPPPYPHTYTTTNVTIITYIYLVKINHVLSAKIQGVCCRIHFGWVVREDTFQ